MGDEGLSDLAHFLVEVPLYSNESAKERTSSQLACQTSMMRGCDMVTARKGKAAPD
jgi:hypothetical protein